LSHEELIGRVDDFLSNDQGVEGTDHLAMMFNARDSSPVDTLTSTVSWPSAADLTLHFKDARTGQIEFLGEQVKIYPSWLMHDPDPTIPHGTLGSPEIIRSSHATIPEQSCRGPCT
jgi:hypothetical protein